MSATRWMVFGGLILTMVVCSWMIGQAAAEDPGERVFKAKCSRCHGPEGRGRGSEGPNLIPYDWDYEKTLEQVRRPLCEMPPFPESDLSDAEVAQIVAYMKTIK